HNQDGASDNRSLIREAAAAPRRAQWRWNCVTRAVAARFHLQLVGSICALAVTGTGHKPSIHQPAQTVLADEEVTAGATILQSKEGPRQSGATGVAGRTRPIAYDSCQPRQTLPFHESP